MKPFAFGVMSCRLPESLKLPGVIELGETRANRGSLVIGHGFWRFCTTDNAKRSTTTNFSSYIYSHAPVLFVQTEPNCKRIYYEESTGAERKALSWAKFKKLAKVAGLPTNISKNTSRLSDKLSTRLNDEWDAVR